VLAVAVAQQICELADQVAGGRQFLAAGGDLRERGRWSSVSLPGAEFLVQLLGAVAAFVPALSQVG
jgi:hypothetical protein